MKKFILLLSVLLLANNAIAVGDLESIKNYVVDNLNNTVSVLKNYFKTADIALKENKIIIEEENIKAHALKDASQKKETNPVVLKQGLAPMPNCDTTTQELAWSNDKWICRPPTYGTDCMPASDEYRYEEDGKIVCSKSAKGKSLNYYWKFRGYGLNCDYSNNKFKIYGCYYKNKNNQEIEIEDSYCETKSKPYQANTSCRIECIIEREPASGSHYNSRSNPYYFWMLNKNTNFLYIQWNSNKIFMGKSSNFNEFKKGEWTYHRGNKDGDLILYSIYRTKITNADVCTP
jgi:hypothetical protein